MTSTPDLPARDGRRRVFAVVDYYLPGFKSGGPLRSVSNLVAWLERDCAFFIFTRDRDATDTHPYPGIQVDAWNEHAGARVFYASPGMLNAATLRRCLAEAAPDVVYLNSFFSGLTIRYLWLRRWGLVPGRTVVIAPRGELSPGALRLKAAKKKLFLLGAQVLGLYRGLRWQATAELERGEIRQALPAARDIHVVANLPAKHAETPAPPPEKRPGQVRLVFCSRIAEKKNLHAVLPLLGRLGGEVVFDIYGPVRDPAYWARCESEIARLPAHVSVRHRGELPHEQVAGTLSRYHFFLLPTLSENFGHAIIEALAAGCPVLLSDQTPWQDLGRDGAGWIVPVADLAAWEQALRAALELDEPAYRRMVGAALRAAAQHFAAPPVAEAVALFA